MNSVQNNTSPSAQPSQWYDAIYNLISLAGGMFALFGVLGVIFIFLQSFFSGEDFAYQGVLIALLLAVIAFGVILVVVGFWRERRRQKAGLAPSFSGESYLAHPFLATIIGLVFVTGTALVMLTGSYQIFKATESVEFCGLLCHSVMHPEWTTYQLSAHKRVECVECHIGEGADWFVRSKLSGMRQVYGVLTGDFHKPIPTPIENLRPARETCEQCHWPYKFVGFKEKIYTYYLGDEENTPHKLRLLIKIGGEEEASTQKGSGIHYYMLKNKVEYVATDHDRQDIAYVRITRPDNSVTVYSNGEIEESEIKPEDFRTMDCLDCHNRPSHLFRAPMDIINDDIRKELVHESVPYIKQQAVIALDEEYQSTEEAMTSIADRLNEFYSSEYEEFAKENPQDVELAIKGVQGIYKKSIFPEMKASWKAYPNNIGHRDWKGCFRCHNEDMVNADGEPLYKGCNDCHIILAQGQDINKAMVDFDTGLQFFHPGNDETFAFDEFVQCTDCHTGGKDLY